MNEQIEKNAQRANKLGIRHYLRMICKYGISVCATFILFRLLICVKYTIVSGSMLPTILVGESVNINKLLFGWRLYDFWSERPEKFYRIGGIRDIVPNDVILFNIPFCENNIGTIRFNADIQYCKRVLGGPGDRIGAVDGHCWNDKLLKPVGVIKEQDKLRWMFDSLFIWRHTYNVIPLEDTTWTIKNWGPLIVPAKGLTVRLDDFSKELYRAVIEYESGESYMDEVLEYEFRQNYYFVVGDNAMDSYDSRYWGFIPEDFIIGIVCGKKVKNVPNQTAH